MTLARRPTALDFAAAVIEWHNEHPESPPLTVQKLMCLLYYIQGWHLAWYGEPAFDDPIYASADGVLL